MNSRYRRKQPAARKPSAFVQEICCCKLDSRIENGNPPSTIFELSRAGFEGQSQRGDNKPVSQHCCAYNCGGGQQMSLSAARLFEIDDERVCGAM